MRVLFISLSFILVETGLPCAISRAGVSGSSSFSSPPSQQIKRQKTQEQQMFSCACKQFQMGPREVTVGERSRLQPQLSSGLSYFKQATKRKQYREFLLVFISLTSLWQISVVRAICSLCTSQLRQAALAVRVRFAASKRNLGATAATKPTPAAAAAMQE